MASGRMRIKNEVCYISGRTMKSAISQALSMEHQTLSHGIKDLEIFRVDTTVLAIQRLGGITDNQLNTFLSLIGFYLVPLPFDVTVR